MKITDYLGSFPKIVREKEQRSLRRVVRIGVKIGIAGVIWYYSWPMGVLLSAVIIPNAQDFGPLVFVGAVLWFVVVYILFSLIFWWGERYYLPKRGIRF